MQRIAPCNIVFARETLAKSDEFRFGSPKMCSCDRSGLGSFDHGGARRAREKVLQGRSMPSTSTVSKSESTLFHAECFDRSLQL